jgi:hypothetical protein
VQGNAHCRGYERCDEERSQESAFRRNTKINHHRRGAKSAEKKYNCLKKSEIQHPKCDGLPAHIVDPVSGVK